MTTNEHRHDAILNGAMRDASDHATAGDPQRACHSIINAVAFIRDRVRALEAAMPQRGTWASGYTDHVHRPAWECRCVGSDVTRLNGSDVAVCTYCYTLRPLPAATPTPVAAAPQPECRDGGDGSDCRARTDALPDLAAMRKAAEAFALCNREWRMGESGVLTRDGLPLGRAFSDGLLFRHIAAACPANVLALIDAYEAAETTRRNDVATIEAARKAQFDFASGLRQEREKANARYEEARVDKRDLLQSVDAAIRQTNNDPKNCSLFEAVQRVLAERDKAKDSFVKERDAGDAVIEQFRRELIAARRDAAAGVDRAIDAENALEMMKTQRDTALVNFDNARKLVAEGLKGADFAGTMAVAALEAKLKDASALTTAARLAAETSDRELSETKTQCAFLTRELASRTAERDDALADRDEIQRRLDETERTLDSAPAPAIPDSELLRQRDEALEQVAWWRKERAVFISLDGKPADRAITAERDVLQDRVNVLMQGREMRAQEIRNLRAEVAALKGERPIVEPPDTATHSKMDAAAEVRAVAEFQAAGYPDDCPAKKHDHFHYCDACVNEPRAQKLYWNASKAYIHPAKPVL